MIRDNKLIVVFRKSKAQNDDGFQPLKTERSMIYGFKSWKGERLMIRMFTEDCVRPRVVGKKLTGVLKVDLDRNNF